MTSETQPEENPEKTYWRSVSEWVVATKKRYQGFRPGDLTQCFMRGPFAGWSERQVLELASQLSQSAIKFPLRGHEYLEWEEEGVEQGAKAVGGADGERGTEDAEGGVYCPVCQSCVEDGCCGVENSIMSHGCKYSQEYAQQVYYDRMIIDEFHKLAEEMGLTRDETGSEVKDPIGDLYDRASRRVAEKYKTP